ncbi:MAG: octanoyltransferase, partial [Lysinibacillus sp.]
EGKKVAGSAQTRQKGVILQHGAILLSLNIEKLLSVFHFQSEEARELMRLQLPQKAVAIDQLTDRKITINDCKKAFHLGFEETLHIELVPYKLTEEQLHEVQKIEREKYANDTWNYKK